MLWQTELVADHREKNVIRHPELGPHTVASLTTGDYFIIRSKPSGHARHISAIIERKEIDDFAASLKDGRHNNKSKMIAMREKTQAVLYYIVECPPDPAPDDYFGGIAFRNILSAADHLQFRDNIHVIWTRNTIQTAARLRTLRENLSTVDWCPESVDVNDTTAVVTLAITPVGEPAPAPAAVPGIDPLLLVMTAPVKKSDHDIVREMWACFRGISIVSADEFINKWSLRDLIIGWIPIEHIKEHKTVIGKKVSKSIIKSLTGIDSAVEIRLLSKAPRISLTNAKEILATRRLRAILEMDASAIAAIPVGSRTIGPIRAANILALFSYTKAPPAGQLVVNTANAN